jgi:hypothetical protein
MAVTSTALSRTCTQHADAVGTVGESTARTYVTGSRAVPISSKHAGLWSPSAPSEPGLRETLLRALNDCQYINTPLNVVYQRFRDPWRTTNLGHLGGGGGHLIRT